MKVQVGDITLIDYPDKVSVPIYFCGCDFNCKECHNSELRNFDYFPSKTLEEIWSDIEYVIQDFGVKSFVLTGGDPLAKPAELISLCEFLINEKEVKDIMLYTGFNFEYIPKNLLNYFNCIKTGTYVEALKTPSGITASSNQKIWRKDEILGLWTNISSTSSDTLLS